MTVTLDQMGLAIDTSTATPTSRSFRPPSWPPPKDWVCIEDSEGNVVSRWGDPIWKFWPWTGCIKTINFGDGPRLRSNSPINDPVNADILRLLVTWRLWGIRGARKFSTVETNFFNPIGKIIAICSEHKILASDLSRYPAVIDVVAQSIAPSAFRQVVAELDRLRDARELLGFEILDQAGIQRLKAAQAKHDPEQTEYIPPRIWSYLVMRQKECLDDFLVHQEKIEACFAFCVDAYEKNGVLEDRIRTGKRSGRNPFRNPRAGATGKRSGITYLGPFVDTAQRFGIKEILERWVGNLEDKQGIPAFSNYLNLTQFAALADVLSFTLMRVNEGANICSNCLNWHDDPVYGRIPLIRAETTKTDPDPDALWITSPSVEQAIRVLTAVARMRLSCIGKWTDDGSPYLINHAFEPWSRPKKAELEVRPSVPAFSLVVSRFPLLFDLKQLTITEDDLSIARAVTPTLNKYLFQVGKPWSLAWHQLRRTGAVNMFASGEISDSSIQLQMKHLTRLMPLYYGRGNSTLHLNEEGRVLLVNAQYEAMGRMLTEVHTERFVSPHGIEHKTRLLASACDGTPVNLVSEVDAIRYEKAARKQHISFRRTVLGGCMKNGPCDGDCISSVGDCAGGDGKGPCANVLFDRGRASANRLRLDGVKAQMAVTQPDTPKFRALAQEQLGLENYFAYINQH